LRKLDEVLSIHPFQPAAGNAHLNGTSHWELQIRESADPQAILQFCFSEKIRLRSFNQSDPSLHEVFVQLVGSQAREAA
jgi:ABC-type uncharacterized transport system ATPase subunit